MFCFGLRKKQKELQARLDRADAEKAAPEMQKLLAEYEAAGGREYVRVSAAKPGFCVKEYGTATHLTEEAFRKIYLAPQYAKWVSNQGGVRKIQEHLPKPEPELYVYPHSLSTYTWNEQLTPPDPKPEKKKKRKKKTS